MVLLMSIWFSKRDYSVFYFINNLLTTSSRVCGYQQLYADLATRAN